MIEIKVGDCVNRLKDLEDNSVDAVLCDPPYGLKFMNKGWDDIGDGLSQREWHREWLKEAYRILKPNGVIKAFSGARTYHHLIYMMDEIGFKDLKVEAWMYGSGFPKSHNVSKAIDKIKGCKRKVVGRREEYEYRHLQRFKEQDGREKKSDLSDIGFITESSSDEAKQFEGFGTALKPSFEPICIGYKK